MIFASRRGGITARSEELSVCGEEPFGPVRLHRMTGLPAPDELAIGCLVGHDSPSEDGVPEGRKAQLEVNQRIPSYRAPAEVENPVVAFLRPVAHKVDHR